MKKLLIVGSSDLAQLIAHHAPSANYEVIGFLDDFRNRGDQTPHGPVLGTISDFKCLTRDLEIDCFSIGIGYKHFKYRMDCFRQCNRILPAASIIHPSCSIDSLAIIEEGCVLLPGCTVDTGVRISKNTLLNVSVTIAHDSEVGENCFLGPAANVAGFTKIASSCFIGTGATLIDNLTIGEFTRIGAGAVVTRSITDPGLYLGVPAKKHSDEGTTTQIKRHFA